MAKRNQNRKKSPKKAEKIEAAPQEEGIIETEVVQGMTCNVFEQEMTWKIPNYRSDKSYSVTFLLPRSIEW